LGLWKVHWSVINLIFPSLAFISPYSIYILICFYLWVGQIIQVGYCLCDISLWKCLNVQRLIACMPIIPSKICNWQWNKKAFIQWLYTMDLW
jgi:hypothetical protein